MMKDDLEDGVYQRCLSFQTSECDMIIVPPCGNALLEEEQAGRVVAARGKVVLRRSVVVR
jgi:hypothetical protein